MSNNNNRFRRIVNTSIPGTQPQINSNTNTVNNHTTAIAVNDQLYVKSSNYTNDPNVGNSLDNLYRAVASGSTPPAITPGRTITFNNSTVSTNLDLYLTVGGTNPKPITKIATINTTGTTSHVWSIPNDVYGWSGNFTVMPAGTAPPKYNAGPTIAEFGLNQYWHGATPSMRDTFDISTVPPGIGTGVNDGPRSAAVAASRAAGFSVQQSYNYNVGIRITPPTGNLPTQVVTCNTTNGDSPNSIGYPNDTAYPKQQTGDAAGNYIVDFIDPVVSLN